MARTNRAWGGRALSAFAVTLGVPGLALAQSDATPTYT